MIENILRLLVRPLRFHLSANPLISALQTLIILPYAVFALITAYSLLLIDALIGAIRSTIKK